MFDPGRNQEIARINNFLNKIIKKRKQEEVLSLSRREKKNRDRAIHQEERQKKQCKLKSQKERVE